MRKFLAAAFFTLIIVLGMTTPVHALDAGACNNVTLDVKVNGNVSIGTLTNDKSTNPTIYYDTFTNNLYYLDDGEYKVIDFSKDVVVGITVDKDTLAKSFSGNTIPSNFHIFMYAGNIGCQTFLYGNDINSSPFVKSDFFNVPTLAGDITGACKKHVLRSTDLLRLYSNQDIYCPNLSFQQGQKPPTVCKINFDAATAAGPTTETNVVVESVSDISAKCLNFVEGNGDDYLLMRTCASAGTVNGVSKDCRLWYPQLGRWVPGIMWLDAKKCDTTALGRYDLGKLDAGTYTLSIAQPFKTLGSDPRTYCQAKIAVVAAGETPTPPVTGTLDPATQSVSITLAGAVSLCNSIPASAMCGGRSCQEKCMECSGDPVHGIWTGLGCLNTDISLLVNQLFKYFSGLLGGFIFICIVWNGIKVMLSRGAPDALKKAQEAITSCIIGLLVLVFSVLFLQVVGVDILKIPGWTKPAAHVHYSSNYDI